MTRKELLDEINELLEDEHGEPITEDKALIDSGIDSFGLTMILVELDQKYGVYPKEIFKDLPFETMTAGRVIDDIMSKHGSK